MIYATRAQRRQLERENAKLPVKLQELPRHEWPDPTSRQLSVWRSRDYLVQVFPGDGAPVTARLSINRTTLTGNRWDDNIPWDDLQRLKAECGFGSSDAVEVYPADKDVVNVANMRHLWVLTGPLPFAWRST